MECFVMYNHYRPAALDESGSGPELQHPAGMQEVQRDTEPAAASAWFAASNGSTKPWLQRLDDVTETNRRERGAFYMLGKSIQPAGGRTTTFQEPLMKQP